MAESYKRGKQMTQAHDPSRDPRLNKMSAKGQAMNLLKRYQDPLATGAVAVVLGFAAKKLFRMENISTNSFKQVLGSFVMVSAAGIAAEELGIATKPLY